MPSTGRDPLLSVVIPAYNEESRLPETLAIVQDYLARAPYAWEVIVADDGSRDATVEAARDSFRDDRCRVLVAEKNGGKGMAVKRGMLAATGRYRLFTDADNSTPIQETGRLLRAMRNTGADVAIGSRALRNSRLEVRQPFYREMMGRTFNLMVQALALPGIHDTQCGFKMFTADAAQWIFPRQKLNGFSFDVEILYIARRHGLRTIEVPIRWVNSPASRVSAIRDSARMFRDVMLIRRLHR